MPANGTSPVTAEMADGLERMFGFRYAHVQDGVKGVGMNRKQRRLAAKRARRGKT